MTVTKPEQSLTLREVADMVDGTLHGDPNYVVFSVADLSSAGPRDLSFFAQPPFGKSRHETALASSAAGAIFVPDISRVDDRRNYIVAEDPSRAFQTVAAHFLAHRRRLSGFAPIHPTAVIHESAHLGQAVHLGPHVTIDQGAIIGDRVRIEAGCYIGPDVRIGSDTHLHSNVTIEGACAVGSRVIIQSSSVIGGCGFGYATDSYGVHHKLEQLGDVVIEDDVHIGACVTIDRARFKTTRIGQGTKIGNSVQIGHGVTTGKHCIIVSHVGLSGSVALGNHVVLGARVGIVEHCTIADGVMIAAGSGVIKSLDKPGTYGGTPAIPVREALRLEVHRMKLAEYADTIKDLQKRLKDLEHRS